MKTLTTKELSGLLGLPFHEVRDMTRSRRSRLWKRARGICYDCSGPAESGRVRCAAHAEIHRQKDRSL